MWKSGITEGGVGWEFPWIQGFQKEAEEWHRMRRRAEVQEPGLKTVPELSFTGASEITRAF